MNGKLKMRIPLLGAILMMSLLSLAAFATEGTGPEVGQPSPNLIGRTPDDKPYRLKSDIGQAKVINFFWVNCKPCKEEMPELAKLEKQYPKIKFISVHTQKESPENVMMFIKALPSAPSNIVLTSGGIQDSFHYLGLPHTVVLDNNNIVLMNLVGYTPENMKKLSESLKQMP